MSSTLPPLAIALTHNFDAWIVGSAAAPDALNPRDIDIIVPHYEWNRAAHLIPKDAKVNSFGGFKCVQDGIEMDVWPGDLGWLMQRPKACWAWHPASGVRLCKVETEVIDLKNTHNGLKVVARRTISINPVSGVVKK